MAKDLAEKMYNVCTNVYNVCTLCVLMYNVCTQCTMCVLSASSGYRIVTYDCS